MCLILVRDPDVPIHFDQIKHAVKNNPHGWGYVIPDRGQLEVRRFFDARGTDPEKVYDVLDTHMDKRVFLHLRFATAGNRDKANVHPFPVLQKRKHGMQAWLMHNGTLNEFTDYKSGMSDTFHFTEQIVTPLLERVAAFRGKTKAINDPFVEKILSKYQGWSKFVLVDNYGNYQTFGGGSQKEGYWVSNDYSFREDHREEKTETKSYSYPSTSTSSDAKKDIEDAEYEDIYNQYSPHGSQCVVPFRNHSTSASSDTQETKPSTNSEPWPPEEPLELAERTKFVELLGLTDILDLLSFTEADLLDMTNEYPDVMAVCTRDLVLEVKRLRELVKHGGV